MMLLEGISVYTVLMRDSTIMECVNTSYRSLNVGIHVCIGITVNCNKGVIMQT